MIKKFFLLSLATLLLLGNACKNDIDTNADWKEILLVYGLLNVNDTTHYIRINKAFLSENLSALEVAKIHDSLYFDTGVLNVVIEEFDGTLYKQTFHLQPTSALPKDTGIFANYPNVLYTFTQRLNPGYKYRLVIINNQSGKITTAETQLVSDITNSSPHNGLTTYLIDTGRNINFSWTAGRNAKVYDLTVRFYWDEYDETTNLLVDSSYIDWTPIQGRTVSGNGNVKILIPGQSFYIYLGDKLTVPVGRYRKAKRMDFYFWGADDEFNTYRNVNQPSVGLVQKKPEYTNISSGNYGLFASRNRFNVNGLAVAPQMHSFLQVYPATHKLKFMQ